MFLTKQIAAYVAAFGKFDVCRTLRRKTTCRSRTTRALLPKSRVGPFLGTAPRAAADFGDQMAVHSRYASGWPKWGKGAYAPRERQRKTLPFQVMVDRVLVHFNRDCRRFGLRSKIFVEWNSLARHLVEM